jgi:hypothetical protein
MWAYQARDPLFAEQYLISQLLCHTCFSFYHTYALLAVFVCVWWIAPITRLAASGILVPINEREIVIFGKHRNSGSCLGLHIVAFFKPIFANSTAFYIFLIRIEYVYKPNGLLVVFC